MGESRRAILSLDIGSTTRRAQLIGVDLEAIDDKVWRIERGIDERADGSATVDPHVLVEDVIALIDDASGFSGAAGVEIAAVATSCMWHSFVGLDENSNPTTPIITWADSRASFHATRVQSLLDDASVHARTGCPIEALYFPAKLLRFRDDTPDLWDRTRQIVSPADYVIGQLTGVIATSPSMASGTGLLDLETVEWDRELLAFLELDQAALPKVTTDAVGVLQGSFAAHWPQLAAAPWFPAIGDGAASTLGVEADEPGSLTITIGTTAAARLAHDHTIAAPPGRSWRYLLDRDHVITGGALSDGGNIIEWLGAVLQLPDPDTIETALLAEPTGGLTMVPTLRGERGPAWVGGGSGVLEGLDHTTRAIDIVYSAFAGVARRLAQIATELAEVTPIESVTITGGALAASPGWRQIVADEFARPVLDATGFESSVRGVARSAWAALADDGEFSAERSTRDLPVIHPRIRAAHSTPPIVAAMSLSDEQL